MKKSVVTISFALLANCSALFGLNIVVSNANISEQVAECVAVIVEDSSSLSERLQPLADTYFSELSTVLAHRKFTGKDGSLLTLTGSKDGRIVDLVFAGVGAPVAGVVSVERYRRALGRIVRTIESSPYKTVLLITPDAALCGLDQESFAQETAQILHMASYQFNEFITDKQRKVQVPETVVVMSTSTSVQAEQAAADRGALIGRGINTCRYWVDMPPSNATPQHVARYATEMAGKCGLAVKVFDEQDVIQMGMGGLAGVSAGSDEDCKFVVLEYHCGDAAAPTIAFVGKGITFDAGGLCIKPAAGMETMKCDMAGAAAVIASMQIIGQLKPTINVIGLTPLSENLLGGKAFKPGDVLRFYNGKTAEIKNTDAEGRLVLADALAYAVKNYKLDAVIDLATLTGACSMALGPFFAGMMSQHEELAGRVQESSKRTGDRVWPLPLDNDYKAALRSSVADMANAGSSEYKAGAIVAAWFLQPFVADVPWVHLDIAPVAFRAPGVPYCRPDNATGAGVRLLVDLAMHWQ